MTFGYDIYLSEHDRNRVIRWSPDTGHVEVIAGEPADGDPSQTLKGPYGLAFDADHNLLIADKYNHRICRLRGGRLEELRPRDASRRPGDPWHQPKLMCPTGLWFEPSGSILCSYPDEGAIYRIRRNGTLQLVLGLDRRYDSKHPWCYGPDVPPEDVPHAPLDSPAGVVAHEDGTIVFIERSAQSLREFHPRRGLRYMFRNDRRGAFFRRRDLPETIVVDEYHPAFPASLTLDADDVLHVTDIQHGCILRLHRACGVLTRVLQVSRASSSALGGPNALAFGPDGTAWVFNTVRNAVEAWRPTGSGPWIDLEVRLTEVGGSPFRVRADRAGGTGLVAG